MKRRVELSDTEDLGFNTDSKDFISKFSYRRIFFFEIRIFKFLRTKLYDFFQNLSKRKETRSRISKYFSLL